jgi:hypothetical protein
MSGLARLLITPDKVSESKHLRCLRACVQATHFVAQFNERANSALAPFDIQPQVNGRAFPRLPL